MENHHCSLCKRTCSSPTPIFVRQPGGELLCNQCLSLYLHSSSTNPQVKLYVSKHKVKVKSFHSFEGSVPHLVVGLRGVGSPSNRKIFLGEPRIRKVTASDDLHHTHPEPSSPQYIPSPQNAPQHTPPQPNPPQCTASDELHHAHPEPSSPQYIPSPQNAPQHTPPQPNPPQCTPPQLPENSPLFDQGQEIETLRGAKEHRCIPTPLFTDSEIARVKKHKTSSSTFGQLSPVAASFKAAEDKKIESLERRVQELEGKIGTLEEKLAKVENENEQNIQKLREKNSFVLSKMNAIRDDVDKVVEDCEE